MKTVKGLFGEPVEIRPEKKEPEKPAPQPTVKQLRLFDSGEGDLPGQKYFFDDN